VKNLSLSSLPNILIILSLILLGYCAIPASALEYADITFAGLDSIDWEAGYTELEFYDLNRDGNPDILSIGDHGSPFINSQEHGIMVYFGDGLGGFSLLQNGNFGYGGLAVGDVNNDGFADIGCGMQHNYSTTDFGDQFIETALSDGFGVNWTPWDDNLASQGETFGMSAVDFSDIDNDGDLDLACASFGFGNPLQIYRNRLDGSWDFAQSLSTGNTDMLVQFGDINIDGKMDVITAYESHTAWFGTGTGYFLPADNNLPAGPLYGISSGDVDNDGGMDIAYWDDGLKVKIWNEAASMWEDASTGLPIWDTGLTALYDMNSDGFCDLVAATNGHAYIYIGNGGNSWNLAASYTISSDPDAPFESLRANADVDHNGFPDITHVTHEGGIVTATSHIRLFKETSTADSLGIKPVFPKGNEVIMSGSVRFLEWSSEVPRGTTAAVNLEYSLSGSGGPLNIIASNLPNSGKYQWIAAPFTNSSNACFRFTIFTPDASAEAYSGVVRIYEPGELLEFNVTPQGTPIVIPPTGGTFSFLVEVIAPTDITAGFDFWTAVILPDGSTFGSLFVRKGILLPGGNMISRTLTQSVPASAPPGTYTFYGYVGVFDNGESWYGEFFTFEKTEGDNSGGILDWNASGWSENETPPITISSLPEEYALFQNYPNPFNPETIVSFYLPNPGEISLKIYNPLGQKIWEHSAFYSNGLQETNWKAENIPSGIYFYSLEVGNFRDVRKMVLLK